jgi:hypothetical protein
VYCVLVGLTIWDYHYQCMEEVGEESGVYISFNNPRTTA